MTTKNRLAIAAALMAAVGAPAAFAADISLHVDADCNGPSLSTIKSDADVNYPVESVRVRSGVWEVCRDTGYRNCIDVARAGCYNLSDLQFWGQVRSIRLINEPSDAAEAIIYRDNGFSGPAVAIHEPKRDMDWMGFPVTSIRVKSGVWEVCERSRFRSPCQKISTNITSLNVIGLKQVGSIRPSSFGGGATPPAGPAGEASFHVRNSCTGPALSTTLNKPDLNYPVRSVQVRSGRWQICSGNDYTGACKVIDAGCANLSEVGFWGQVRSARVIEENIVPQPR